jgi:hypothetical protein
MSAVEQRARGAGADGNPFSARSVILLVLFGAGVFVLLLWMIGSGMASGPANDGGSHVGGRGLNGYAALAEYLEERGHTVRRSRNEGALNNAGLLVLTPPQWTDGAELEEIVSARRYAGPTLVVTPKWLPVKAPQGAKGAKEGWVYLDNTTEPTWQGFLDDVGVTIAPVSGRNGAGWKGAGLSGTLPDAQKVLSGTGPRLAPLVVSQSGGRILAAYVEDGGNYPMLEDLAIDLKGRTELDDDIYPIVVVFEPDLLDNYGMSSKQNALLAEKLFAAAGEHAEDQPIVFDLTLNGHGRTTNLLTLAFTPPFLAATLCLILAAIALGWRAFLRFGPPRRSGRAIAYGKRALVANTAGLLRRTRRFHLISGPYIGWARRRLVQALGLPREAGQAETDAAIDRALAARQPDATPFTRIVARLSAATRPYDLVQAAHDLHALERTLTR